MKRRAVSRRGTGAVAPLRVTPVGQMGIRSWPEHSALFTDGSDLVQPVNQPPAANKAHQGHLPGTSTKPNVPRMVIGPGLRDVVWASTGPSL